MHMRRKPWAKPELLECPFYTDEPERFRGLWRQTFRQDQPLHVELGCGKGVSTSEMASANRNINYLAVDVVCDILGYARRNAEAAYRGEEVTNLRLVKENVEFIDRMFAPEDRVERIYIHFCSPWGTSPHDARHRFTHPRQLMRYRDFLVDGGEVYFKTDDACLFSDSLNYFSVCGFDRVFVTEDLHASGFSPNYQSEYERKFAALGLPVFFGIFRKRPGDPAPDRAFWHIPDGR